MICGIYGQSLTGKTTISRLIAAELSIPLRACGDSIRARAAELGIGIDKLDLAQHRQVDNETVEWATSSTPCIVEGRFLNSVLAKLGSDVVLVQLEASVEDRQLRLQSLRSGVAIQEVDRSDDEFRARAYEVKRKRAPAISLNTSKLLVPECVEIVTALIRPRMFRAD